MSINIHINKKMACDNYVNCKTINLMIMYDDHY